MGTVLRPAGRDRVRGLSRQSVAQHLCDHGDNFKRWKLIIKQHSAQSVDTYHLLDPAVIEAPYAFYRALLAEAPVYRVPGTEVFLVATSQLVHEVLANQDDYSANLTGVLIRGEDGEPALFDLSQFGGTVDAIANADEPSHSVHRRLVMPQLTARRVGELEGEVRDWARRGVATLLANGGGDCIGDLANAIPVMVTARLIGLPIEDVDQLLGWAFSGGEILSGTKSLAEMAQIGTATRAMSEYLADKLELASRDPAETPHDILAELASGIRRGSISEREAVGILVVLVGAAGESTSSLIGSGIRMMAESPSLQAQLRSEPALLPRFIEEVVRLEAPFKGHYRVVVNDTTLGGVRLPAQSRVFLLWAAANRDPSVFADPDKLDLKRRDGGEHLGFGHGIHFCIGARLARMEARIVFEELLAATGTFTVDRPPRHLQSIFVRRLPELTLRVTPPEV